jgi:endonuclease/exonuclease/phosphatase family metal-dependent hydrolase
VTLLTWNVQSGKDVSGHPAVPAQASVIAQSGAQVVALQEVEEAPGPNPPSTYASLLRGQTGADWSVLWIPTPTPPTRPPIGNVLLSRLPIVSSTTIQFDAVPSDPTWIDAKRGAGAIVVNVSGVPLTIATTHLPTDQQLRETVISRLVGWLGSLSSPRLVGGDFNMLAGEPAYAVMAGSWTDLWTVLGSGAGVTKPGSNPRRIDYWWSDGNPHIQPASIRVLSTDASDHYGLLLDVQIAAGTPAGATLRK